MCVPVWTFLASIACSLDEKTTNMWAIALIIRVVPGHLLQHFPGSRSNTSSFYQRFARPKLSSVRSVNHIYCNPFSNEAETYLALHVLCIVLSINFARRRLGLDC